MEKSDLGKLIVEHRFLIEEEREIQSKLRANSERMAKVLASAGFYDLLIVDWDQADRELINNT